MRVGGLIAPRAEAVTSTMPVLAGVQILKAGAFHVPAQAKPLGAMSSTPGGLEGLTAKVKVVLRAPLALFVAVAVNNIVVPACKERLGLGFSVILAGKGEGPGGLLPPHPGKNRNKKIAAKGQADQPKRNLPMHPLVASSLFQMGEPLNGMENC